MLDGLTCLIDRRTGRNAANGELQEPESRFPRIFQFKGRCHPLPCRRTIASTSPVRQTTALGAVFVDFGLLFREEFSQ